MRILLVERDASLSISRLCDPRTFVLHADQPDEALSILRHETFDLVVLDVTSLAEAGFALIRRLREARNYTPLIALTGRHVDERLRALSLGADDAISQPVEAVDLQACIAAVSRRHNGYGQSSIQFGALSLSLETHEVWFRNLPILLTPMEYSTLELLIIRKGQVVAKDMFLTHLYNGVDEPEIKIIDVFICKLRKKLDKAGAAGLIRTVYGQGYTIRNIGDNASASAVAASSESQQRIPTITVQHRTDRGYAW
jgi:two-component system cell cycle response regulator CtrA